MFTIKVITRSTVCYHLLSRGALYLASPLCLLMIFANSLGPDQDRQNTRSDLDQKLFVTLMVFLKEFVEKVDFEKSQQGSKEHANFPNIKELKGNILGLTFSRENQSCLLIVSLL